MSQSSVRRVKKASKLLRRCMKARGWKIADLSRATGLDDGHLSRIVRGERRAGLEASHKIAEATDGEVPVPLWLEA